MTESAFHKELDLIQSVISRMAQNSFLVKGWGISLVAIILALTQGKEFDGSNSIIVLILVGILIFSFWFLDAYFLQLERRYRKHYEWVIQNRDLPGRLLYDLKLKKEYFLKKDAIPNIMISISLLPFYGVPFLMVIGLLIYQIGKHYYIWG